MLKKDWPKNIKVSSVTGNTLFFFNFQRKIVNNSSTISFKLTYVLGAQKIPLIDFSENSP